MRELQSNAAAPLAGGLTAAVTIDAVVTHYDAEYGLATLTVGATQLIAPISSVPIGTRHRVTIAAANVSLAHEPPQGTTILNILPCRVVSATRSEHNEIVAVLGIGPEGAGVRLLAHVTRLSWDQNKFSEDMAIYCQVKSVTVLPS